MTHDEKVEAWAHASTWVGPDDRAEAYATWYVERYADRSFDDLPSHRDVWPYFLLERSR